MSSFYPRAYRDANERGFTLFLAIVITATLLLVATGLVTLAVKQARISSAARESQYAFYAADAGIECAIYWDVRNPSGVSAFSTGGTSSIRCNQDALNSTNPTPSLVGGSSQSVFTLTFLPDPYCAVVTVTKSPGLSGAGLVAHWNMDENSGTSAGDSSGNNNDGTLINNPTWTGGVMGSSLSFDGTNDHVVVSDDTTLNSPRITIATWVNPSVNNGILVSKANGSQFYIRLFSTSIRFIADISGTLRSMQPTYTVPLNTWSHIAATYDGSNMILYVNGVSIGSLSALGAINPSSGGVDLGRRGVSNINYFDGQLDDVRIYDRALSAAEIVALNNIPPASGELTTIESRGYNTCNSANNRRVERAVRATY